MTLSLKTIFSFLLLLVASDLLACPKGTEWKASISPYGDKSVEYFDLGDTITPEDAGFSCTTVNDESSEDFELAKLIVSDLQIVKAKCTFKNGGSVTASAQSGKKGGASIARDVSLKLKSSGESKEYFLTVACRNTVDPRLKQ